MNEPQSLTAPAQRFRPTSDDLARIRFLTCNFQFLQGLWLAVPLGLLMIALGAAELVGIHSTPIDSLGIYFFWFAKPELYYRRRFGQVVRPNRRFRTATQPWALFAAIAFVVGDAVWLIAVARNARPIYVLCGVVLIWLWLETGHSPRLYYYPLLGSLVLAVAAPNAMFGYLLPAMTNFGMGILFVGTVIFLVGLLDHRQLVVGMPWLPQTAEDDEDTEATAEAAR